MDPFTLISGILGAAGTIGGGIMGANAQDEAAKQNQMANMMNFYLRQQERFDQQRMAQRVLNDQYLGATDAQGNRTMFVPGRGWVTFKSQTGAALQGASDAEAHRQLAGDLPTKRAQMYKNLTRQNEEGAYADSLRDELQNTHVDEGEIRREMLGNFLRGINQNYDDATNSAMRKSIRTGSSNTGQILASMARERAKSVGDAYASVGTQARSTAAALEGQKKSNLANLYNMFATRAGAMPGVTFQPQNVNATADNLMKSFAGRAGAGESAVISSAGKQGGSYDYIEPNMGWANAVSSGGQALGSIFDRGSAAEDKNRWFDMYSKRFAGGNVGI